MSATQPPDDPRPHSELLELIPWYLNGTLSDAEKRALDGHLPLCAECRSELEQWRSLAARLTEDDPALLPHPIGFRRLVERLVDDAAEPEEPSGGSRRRAVPSGRIWRRVVIAQAAAIVVLAWVAISPARRPPPEPSFHTLADAPQRSEAWRLRIVFAERTSERELRALLLPLDASIVGGPSPLGVYTVAIPDRFAVAETLAALRGRAAVQFAERVPNEPGEITP